MQKRETKMPLNPWTRPTVRRIATGSAESGGVTLVVDGSGQFS